MNKPIPKSLSQIVTSTSSSNSKKTSSPPAPDATRETVESIVIAVILAFLFRTFVAEAFVIPTGSMAPTLQGSHKDIACEKCGYQYQAGASMENADRQQGFVRDTTCPICRFQTVVEKKPAHETFTGDRILVSKFSYDLDEPQRWDVIVFKFPGNAKQNYIKRLVGLPNETLRVQYGDIHVKKDGDNEFHILRKPPHKIKAMLQMVDDTAHISEELAAARWPSRWQPGAESNEVRLAATDLTDGIELKSTAETESWVRYRHLVPTPSTWLDLERGEKTILPTPETADGQLITDFYAYNAVNQNTGTFEANGTHWVGDLAVECEVEIASNEGVLLFDLVKGGIHFRCEIDIATSKATMKIIGDQATFFGSQGNAITDPLGITPIKGAGKHHIRFSNIDEELRLWVDEEVIDFSQPTTYKPDDLDVVPKWAPGDHGDLEPVGMGVAGAEVLVSRARVLRDVYYIATQGGQQDEYMKALNDDSRHLVPSFINQTEIKEIFLSPKKWEQTALFKDRIYADFSLAKDQFFPMGDNSPQSDDARRWNSAPPYVERDMLIGKALIVYWPHMKNEPIRFTPNFGRMRLIR